MLNIGLSTLVEFLEKKTSLGEVKNDLNFKLNDEQYAALEAAFKGDKEIRTQAEKIFKKAEKKVEKKAEKKPQEVAVTPSDLRIRQEVKPLGTIDLSTVGKPAKKEEPAPAPAPQDEKPEVEATAAPATPEVKAEELPKQEEEKQPEPKEAEPQKAEQPETKAETPAEEPKAVETPKTPDVPKKEEAPKETAPASTKKEVEVFTLKSDRRTVARPNVLGTIDLSAINQSTRPKKKSKEEKRKEREEKAQVSADRKKRVRIGKERVGYQRCRQPATGWQERQECPHHAGTA